MKNLIRNIIYPIILLICGVSLLHSQTDPLHVQFSTEDGLPSNTVYDIIQDKNGYIWAGTENGICKFNGKTFKTLNDDHLINNEISYLHELKDGSIWAVTFGNQVVRIIDDSIHVLDIFNPYLNDFKYFEMAQANDSTLIVKNSNRILSVNPFRVSVKELYETQIINVRSRDLIVPFSTDGNEIFYQIIKGQKVINLHYHLLTDNIKKDTFLNREYGFDGAFFSHGKTFKWNNSLVQISDDSTNVKYDTNDWFPNDRILTCNGISEHEHWINTTDGSIRLQDKRRIMSSYGTTKVIKDMEGNYWVSTHEFGLFLIPNMEIGIWLEMDTELDRITHMKNHLFVSDNTQFLKSLHVEHPEELQSYPLNYPNVKFLFSDTLNERIIVNDGSTTMIRYEDGQFNSFLPPNIKSWYNGLRLGYFSDDSFIRVYKSNICVVRSDTLTSDYDSLLNHHWSRVKTQYCIEFGVLTSAIKDGYYDSVNNTFWLVLANQVLISESDSIREFKYNDKSIRGNRIESDPSGNVYIFLDDDGFLKINRNHEIQQYKSTQLKTLGTIRKAIYRDNQVFCLSNQGFLIYNLITNEQITLDRTDGVFGAKINDFDIMDDHVFLTFQNKLIKAHIPSIKDNKHPPKTFLNHLIVNGKMQAIPTSSVSFPYQSDIEVQFDAPSFKGGQHSKHLYRLNDYTTWVEVSGNTQSIRQLNLSAGSYNFSIKTINEDGLEGPISSFNFSIQSPFWLRWWFILGILSIIGLSLFAYYRNTIKRLEKENQLEQEIRSNQLSALQSRMNPHFIFNALNSIQDFIIRMDKEGANEYLGIFSNLIRIYLRHSEHPMIELQEEIEVLELYLKLEQLRFEDIEIEINIDPNLRRYDIMIPPLFIQPYVENAFKHGLLHKKHNKKLNISFSLDKSNEILDIRINDNGIGRKRCLEINKKTPHSGLSYSTKANKRRLQLINHNRTDKIRVEFRDLYPDEYDQGTSVSIRIPIII